MAGPSTSFLVSAMEGAAMEGQREYRKGNWTLHETVVLIAAKKLDDERRLKGGERERSKPAELRWKWVENYCWRNGCLRSQNQCNDKWDNLLRDYKKVRDYELRLSSGQPSYWILEKHERKEKGLPSNLLSQVYEALHEVVDKRYPPNKLPPPPPHPPLHVPFMADQAASHPPLLTAPPGSAAPPQPASGQCSAEPSSSSDSEESEVPPSPSKKRKVWEGVDGLRSAVENTTLELTRTLLTCEEKKDRRHRDLLTIEERKLNIEETKIEISRQGIAGLIGAVNNLANAILTLVSDKNLAED